MTTVAQIEVGATSFLTSQHGPLKAGLPRTSEDHFCVCRTPTIFTSHA
jgi:hypothetical protein